MRTITQANNERIAATIGRVKVRRDATMDYLAIVDALEPWNPDQSDDDFRPVMEYLSREENSTLASVFSAALLDILGIKSPLAWYEVIRVVAATPAEKCKAFLQAINKQGESLCK